MNHLTHPRFSNKSKIHHPITYRLPPQKKKIWSPNGHSTLLNQIWKTPTTTPTKTATFKAQSKIPRPKCRHHHQRQTPPPPPPFHAQTQLSSSLSLSSLFSPSLSSSSPTKSHLSQIPKTPYKSLKLSSKSM